MVNLSDQFPDILEPPKEWEIVKWCPECGIPFKRFFISYEKGEETGWTCPKCGLTYDVGGLFDSNWNRKDSKIKEVVVGVVSQTLWKVWR